VAQKVLLPKLGLTMEEGTILEWVAKPGDIVRHGDVLLRIGTDKVDADVEAEGEGRFEPVVAEGVTLPPGALIGWLLDGDERPPVQSTGGRLLASPNAKRVAAAYGIDLSALTGTGPGGRIVSEDVEDALAAAQPGFAGAGQGDTARVESERGPAAVSASPLVRRDAAAHGVDLSQVAGSGPGGRILRADVVAAAATVSVTGGPVTDGPAKDGAAPAGPATRAIPLTGMRGAIARSMHASLQEMAQLTHGYEAEVGGLLALRETLKGEWEGTGRRVPSINDFVVRAVALALPDHPLLNATVRDNAIHLLEQVHVGLAVAVPDGLVVPVITDADRRSLTDIAETTRFLAAAAREGTLTLTQLEGATFVVTSLGSYGVDFFTPVVNPGNTAILGVGRVRDGVRWEGDVPHRTSVLTLSLSFDHRAVDGAPAAEFLRTVSGLLARPHLLLAG
jgi:pyruvate dehydrogenase E2 component (dihydrolipoamide acetyltransferase)